MYILLGAILEQIYPYPAIRSFETILIPPAVTFQPLTDRHHYTTSPWKRGVSIVISIYIRPRSYPSCQVRCRFVYRCLFLPVYQIGYSKMPSTMACRQ